MGCLECKEKEDPTNNAQENNNNNDNPPNNMDKENENPLNNNYATGKDNNNNNDNSQNNTDKLNLNDPKAAKKRSSIFRAKTNAEDFDFYNYKDQMLNCHNELRKKHNAQELTENEDLSEMAETTAKEIIENENKYEYQDNIYNSMYVGENIIITNSKNAEDIFNLMLKEGKNYDFNSNNFSKETGHFTQMIWKETTDIGFGFWENKNKNDANKYCSVILYYPTGNVLGEFSKNIEKEIKD